MSYSCILDLINPDEYVCIFGIFLVCLYFTYLACDLHIYTLYPLLYGISLIVPVLLLSALLFCHSLWGMGKMWTCGLADQRAGKLQTKFADRFYPCALPVATTRVPRVGIATLRAIGFTLFMGPSFPPSTSFSPPIPSSSITSPSPHSP